MDMNIPNELLYTKTHEWIRKEADGTLTVGISDFAQDQLGELVYVELPELGRQVSASDTCAVVESVKAASDIYAPVAGDVVAVNSALVATPNLVNKAPYESWLFRLKPQSIADLSRLLDATTYGATVKA
jgi:glycine cleavage system H protein